MDSGFEIAYRSFFSDSLLLLVFWFFSMRSKCSWNSLPALLIPADLLVCWFVPSGGPLCYEPMTDLETVEPILGSMGLQTSETCAAQIVSEEPSCLLL